MKYLSILIVSGLLAVAAAACIERDDELPLEPETIGSTESPLTGDQIEVLSPAQETALADVDAARAAFSTCWLNNPDSECEAQHAAMIAAMTAYENAE